MIAFVEKCPDEEWERSFKQHEESSRIGYYLKGEDRDLITHEGIELDMKVDLRTTL